MKGGGGYSHGLKMKQLSLFFIIFVFVCASLLLWNWDNLTTLLPPDDHPLHLFPVEVERKHATPVKPEQLPPSLSTPLNTPHETSHLDNTTLLLDKSISEPKELSKQQSTVINTPMAELETKDGWAYRFPMTNTTILYYWSASLCDIEPIDPTSETTDYAMHLDRPPAFLKHFLDRIHVLVLNTGHHWNRGKLNANRWVMHVGRKPNTNRRIADIGGAKNFTIHSVVRWVNAELPKHPGLKAFLRSISPRHFFNGEWNTGGTCDSTSPGSLEVLQEESSDLVAASAVKGTDVKLLDITGLSLVREEGHISRYSIRAAPGMQDCLHWCLPGVPDTWNELLFAQI